MATDSCFFSFSNTFHFYCNLFCYLLTYLFTYLFFYFLLCINVFDLLSIKKEKNKKKIKKIMMVYFNLFYFLTLLFQEDERDIFKKIAIGKTIGMVT